MTIPEDMSELVDVNIDRVDLVGKAANGRSFLLAKSALIDPETVRELIKEADEPAADLAVFEDLASVLKAGRALSSANEAALRNAADAIQKVLASLPAPEAAPVEKETPVAEETTETPVEKETEESAPEAAEAPAEKAEDAEPEAPAEVVEKADAVMPVYDNMGQLVGFVKPNALTPVTSPDAEEAAESPEEEAAEEEAEVQPQDGAPTEALADDETEIPGTETVASPVEKGTEQPVTQAPDVAALLKELLGPLAEKIASVADLASTVELLKERVDTIGREPDDRNSPKLNGATGTAGVAKRSADSDVLATLAKSVELAKESGDPTRIANAQQDYTFAAIKERFQLHN